MKKLPYIEDYIDLMSSGSFVWPPKESLIKLARYDQPIVDSMADQINKGTGFTDRQSVLAHKIVIKYKRQWAMAGYEITDHILNPKYKLPIRNIDRRKFIEIVDNTIEIRFPYDQDLISKLRAGVSSIDGNLLWQPKKHAWVASLVEPRILWAKEFGAANNFEFGTTFNDVLEQLLSTTDYVIELKKLNDEFVIVNAESSLNEYVSDNIGFGIENLYKIVDYSSILGYTVDSAIRQHVTDLHGPTIADLLTNKNINLTYDNDLEEFKDIIKYAELSGRYPIYVFETGSNILLRQIQMHFASEDIISQGHHLLSSEQIQRAKVVYFTSWKNIKFDMPLFISLHTFVIGHRRQLVATQAEKIVYYTKMTDHADL